MHCFKNITSITLSDSVPDYSVSKQQTKDEYVSSKTTRRDVSFNQRKDLGLDLKRGEVRNMTALRVQKEICTIPNPKNGVIFQGRMVELQNEEKRDDIGSSRFDGLVAHWKAQESRWK